MEKANENKLILKNCRIIDFQDDFDFSLKDIFIENGLVKEMGNLKINDKSIKTVDLKGKIVSPGIVCSHNHLYSVFAKGITVDFPQMNNFLSILKNFWWKLDLSIDEETLYYCTLIGTIDAVKSGITTIFDHNSSPNFIKNSLKTIEKGFLKTGLRGVLSYEVSDRNGEYNMIEGIEENLSFSNYLKEKKLENQEYLIESAIGAHASFTLGDRALQLLSMAVDRTGKGIHIHVAEDKYDEDYSLNNYGKTPVERLCDFGVLDKNSILAHCVHINKEDINLINKHNSFVVHNPKSNMNNSIGYFKSINKLKNIALGTDGIGSDIISELKMSFFKNKEIKENINNEIFLKLIKNSHKMTENYFKMKFGKIDLGYTADFTIFDCDVHTPINQQNILSHLIFDNYERKVNSVIVNGKLIYHNREFPFDTDEIYQKGIKLASKLWEKIEKLK